MQSAIALLPEVRGKVMEIAMPDFRPDDFGEIGPRGFPGPFETPVNGEVKVCPK